MRRALHTWTLGTALVDLLRVARIVGWEGIAGFVSYEAPDEAAWRLDRLRSPGTHSEATRAVLDQSL